jgi:type I restriction enzyme S subunit
MTNQIKTGYKQTEIGVIPEDWEVKPLNEITSLMTNGFVGISKTHYTDFDNSVMYIQGFNVEENSFNFTGIKKVTEEFHKQHSKSCLQEGDLLTIQTGDVGLTTIVPKELAGSNCHALIITRFKQKKIEPKFFSYYFNSWKGKNQLKEIETGTTMKHINVGHMIDVEVPIPPKQEQIAIAAALSDVDALMGELDKLIAKKRDIKQATMQQLLTGKKRLAGFSGEWKVKRLIELVDCFDNLRVPLNESQRDKMRGDYPYCGANGVLDFVNDYTIDDDIILIAEDGGYFDEYAYRPIAYRMRGKCWVNNHAHILKSKSEFEQEFVFYSLVHKNILNFLASGTRAKLNKSEMWKIEINTPPTKEEQTAIATILSDMDAEISQLEARRAKTAQLKQGMMQELLTGRIRLVSNKIIGETP